MDAYEALQAIQRLARIALASEQGQPAEVLADIQRRALNVSWSSPGRRWRKHREQRTVRCTKKRAALAPRDR
jgi:hypothetical protein